MDTTQIAAGLPNGGDPAQQGIGNQDPKRGGTASLPAGQQQDPAQLQAQAYAMIDNDPSIDADTKVIYKQMYDTYAGGPNADHKEILAAFDDFVRTTIEPKYADLANQAKYSLQQNVSALDASRKTEFEKQNALAGEAVRGTTAGLEASGLLNTGEAVKQLGSAGAPAVPFGGKPIEGLVPQANRLIATDTQNRYQENLRSQYNTAEQALGTAGLGGLVPQGSQIGGVRGTQATDMMSEKLTAMGNAEKNDATKVAINTAQGKAQ